MRQQEAAAATARDADASDGSKDAVQREQSVSTAWIPTSQADVARRVSEGEEWRGTVAQKAVRRVPLALCVLRRSPLRGSRCSTPHSLIVSLTASLVRSEPLLLFSAAAFPVTFSCSSLLLCQIMVRSRLPASFREQIRDPFLQNSCLYPLQRASAAHTHSVPPSPCRATSATERAQGRERPLTSSNLPSTQLLPRSSPASPSPAHAPHVRRGTRSDTKRRARSLNKRHTPLTVHTEGTAKGQKEADREVARYTAHVPLVDTFSEEDMFILPCKSHATASSHAQ